MISDDFLQELKSKADIVELISSYVKLKPSGRSLTGLCPFHSEKTPSFVVDRDKALFHCFGCGVGGDVITFVRKIENLDYVSAIKFLSDRFGISFPEKDEFYSETSKLKMKILEANREAARFFYRNLHSRWGKEALEYLKERGLNPQTMQKFGLGFAPDDDGLSSYLKTKGYSEDLLVSANLAYKKTNGFSISDRFKKRIIFPIIDIRANIIAFGGRSISNYGPKYLNTSDTLVFKKRSNLYAINFAQKSTEDFFVLTEGYMDVISLVQAGFSSSIATLGTSLTVDQAKLMARYKDQVIIAYDSDNAGMVATSRAITILNDAGILVKILDLNKYKDPDEFIKHNGANATAKLKNLLLNSKNSIDYGLDRIKENHDVSSIDGKIGYLNDAVVFLASLDNKIERDLYASKLANELGVYKDNILEQIKKEEKKRHQKQSKNRVNLRSNFKNESIKNGKFVISRTLAAEKALLANIVSNQVVDGHIFEALSPESIEDDLIRKIYENIKSRYENGRNFDIIDLSQDFSEKEMAFISEIICDYTFATESGKADLFEFIKIINSEYEKRIFYRDGKIDDTNALNLYLSKLKNEKS